MANSLSSGKSYILVYAELLSNIRQISVVAELPSPKNLGTHARITNSGRSLEVYHNGDKETLLLPAGTSASGTLPLPSHSSQKLSWRLPLDVAEFQPPAAVVDVSSWSSADLGVATAVLCRACSGNLVEKGVIQAWKDLPSDNWAEMMEFWHCHKPHDPEPGNGDQEAQVLKGYGAENAIKAQSGVGFVDLVSFLFMEADCIGLEVPPSAAIQSDNDDPLLAQDRRISNKASRVLCRQCKDQVGLFQLDKAGFSLFKWKVSCKSTSGSSHAPTGLDCLAATLVTTISRSGSAKAVIIPQEYSTDLGEDAVAEYNGQISPIYVWILNSSVTFSSSRDRAVRTAMKVLYQFVDFSTAMQMVESLTSSVQDISFPSEVVEQAKAKLVSSTDLLPPSERLFKEWKVGLIPRLDIELGSIEKLGSSIARTAI